MGGAIFASRVKEDKVGLCGLETDRRTLPPWARVEKSIHALGISCRCWLFRGKIWRCFFFSQTVSWRRQSLEKVVFWEVGSRLCLNKFPRVQRTWRFIPFALSRRAPFIRGALLTNLFSTEFYVYFYPRGNVAFEGIRISEYTYIERERK